MSVTHLPGTWVNIGGRVIQRCAICGDKLVDCHPSRQLVVFGSAPHSPTFAEGTLLTVQEGPGNGKMFSSAGDFATAPLPEDFCLRLVEADL